MDSPGAFLARLLALPGYEWDTKNPPFHSSYDNWHFYGSQVLDNSASTPPISWTPSPPHLTPSRKYSEARPSIQSRAHSTESVKAGYTIQDLSVQRQVVARVSRHALRLEREFQLCKQVFDEDPASRDHFVRPIEFIKSGPRHGEDGLAISIFEAPGPNYLRDLVSFGANSYLGVHIDSQWTYKAVERDVVRPTLQQFMDFAIGATACLEILHHKHRVVHGEIRGDAFHFNEQTGQVKMINFGSGPRAFESGLSSAGWYTLSREFGIEHKLTFIAPEQTGRLPAQPDGRTDIYSLGVLFWCMLTGETPFRGDTPLIIMQNVLSRRIPYVSSRRIEVPDALSSVISKMAHRNIDSRYNSVTGLKHDLTEIRRLLDDGDLEAIQTFEVATKDVSSYFTLPSGLVGRKKEQDQIYHIIDTFYASFQRSSRSKKSALKASAHSASEIQNETGSIDGVSETSSPKGSNGRQSSGGASLQEENFVHKPLDHPQPTVDRESAHLNSLRRTISMKEGKQTESRSVSSSIHLNTIAFEATTNLFRQGSRSKSPQMCQVISIVGATGLGKSAVLQSIQGHVRTRGYYMFAKFDQARISPFGPILRILSSLFRQIFSEADVSTELHDHIRVHVQPAWSVLHSQLDLPIWLLNPVPKGSQKTSTSSHTAGESRRKGSRSTHHGSGNVAAEWLRSGGTGKSSRFMNMFLGVFQIIASAKFVCVCLDDLQYADPESLELLANMVSARVPVLLVLTSREGDKLSKRASSLVSGSDKVRLEPFAEEQTAEYVSATIHRDRDYVLPLVAVIQEKSGGNPFFIKEILETCYRKDCLYYSWINSAWVYDLDKVFAEFISQDYGSQVNNEFVMTRLQELPSSARLLLAWASLIGGSFSFSFVKILMSTPVRSHDSTVLPSPGSQDAVSALQSALSAYILVPGNNEDRFCFSHDRYVLAAGSLAECYDKPEMHYTIAKTLIEHTNVPWLTSRSVHGKSRHISLALDLLKERERDRYPYREVLSDAAENSLESGARATARRYLSHALSLLQDDPWDESARDVSYQETLKLHIKAAENNWYQNDFANATRLVETVYKHAKTLTDMAPCWVIESRIYARQGNSTKAFDCLKMALGKLRVSLPATSLEHCDQEFNRLRPELEKLDDQELVSREQRGDPERDVIGLLLVELGSAAFWSSLVLFYQVSIVMVRVHLDLGSYPQAGLAYLYLGSIALARLGLMDLGCKLGDIAKYLFDIHNDDLFTIGRGLTLHALFIGHLQDDYQTSMLQLEHAGEASVSAGDRIMSLLNLGMTSAVRVSMSQNLVEIEAFIQEAPSEYPDWASDMRGGVYLVGVRQYCRALQGKTCGTASRIFDDLDGNHNANDYLELIKSKSSPSVRQLSVYLTFKQMALFRFGQLNEALELGEQLVKTCDEWLSARLVFDIRIYLCLSYCGRIRDSASETEKATKLDNIATHRKAIERVAETNPVNFKAWLLLLDAEIADVKGNRYEASTSYEDALDHSQIYGRDMDEALILELYAESLIRLGSRRSAKRLLLECQSCYRRVSAFGKVNQVEKKYERLLNISANQAAHDVGCQTDFVDSHNSTYVLEPPSKDLTSPEASNDHRSSWLVPGSSRQDSKLADSHNHSSANGRNMAPQDFATMGLDMIDLASILESSQLLSSVIQIDSLMGKMAEIITETATADLVGIVIKDERREWIVSAIGTPDGLQTFPDGLSLETSEVDKQLALQVTTYVLRFKETVFIHNLLEDERFSTVSQAYLEKNPGGKAIMSLPILHGNDELLGVIHVEGQPNKFTERNLTVLRLLVNQISISLANALVMKQVEKVSAENAAMLRVQRTALERAREAEKKSKDAEAEAIRNMHLKEEAAKAKSMFLANVSHELRTPLNGVIGISQLLKETSLTATQTEYVDSIETCGDTLLSLINDLLDFTKLDAGKMTMNLVPLNLTKTIKEVIRALSYQNIEKGLNTDQQLEIDPRMIIVGDPVRLHQVLMNLLSNSYKFTMKGGVTVKAVTEKETATDITITVTVTDTGIGVPEGQRTKLFQPFSQVENTSSRSYQGTGLGLSICKALVEGLMGGKIWLESKSGGGTTVGFTIAYRKATGAEIANAATVLSTPASPMPSPTPSTPPAIIVPTNPLVAGRRKITKPPNHLSFNDISDIPHNEIRICIAEDNIINQKIAIAFLKQLGLKGEAFVNGRRAIEGLEKASNEGRPFHVVLMDIQMPVQDGYDATREIRRHRDSTIRDILVIAMTASAILGDREKCLEAGMNDYLAKPVRIVDLKTILESYVHPGGS